MRVRPASPKDRSQYTTLQISSIPFSPICVHHHLDHAEVRRLEAVVVPGHRPHHGRPRPLDHQQALALALNLVALVVAYAGLNAEERERGGARLERRAAHQRRDHVRAGLGLPPCVHDRALAVADHLMVPPPRLGVDGLADAAQQPEAGALVVGDKAVALGVQRADGGGRGVEDGDLEDKRRPR